MPGVADNEWKTVYLRVKVRSGAVCKFDYSLDGKKYTTVGAAFTARQGKWIGAKVGVFCLTPNEGNRGCADIDLSLIHIYSIMETITNTSDNIITNSYKEYRQVILTYITYRITHRYEAEDLAQDVFVRLLDYKQMLRPDTRCV